jgi:hypothetical protein
MRWMTALVASALLTSTAAAQSIAPNLQSGMPSVITAPLPAIPQATGETRGLSIPTATVMAPEAPTAAPRATTVEQMTAPKASGLRETQARIARPARDARAEQPREIHRQSQAYRTYPSAARSLGRFWPPVF